MGSSSEKKWTPGPWYVKYCGHQDAGSACRISDNPDCTDDYGGVVYDTNHDECNHMMSVADARLIAAAPDLYDALESALALFDADHALSRFDWGSSFLRAGDIRELNELPGIIRAALAKARGEKA
jgi:hypothetical protein